MKERPILMSAPMVRAILAGTKTQTRRVVKLPHQNPLGNWEPMRIGGQDGGRTRDGETIPEQGAIWHTRTGDCLSSPYGQPGDRLWVRETGWESPIRTQKMLREGADTWANYYYDADGLTESDHEQFKEWGFKRRPSFFMPRCFSRLTLEITGVRVERLQEITENDALAEGIERTVIGGGWRRYCDDSRQEAAGLPPCETPTQSYLSLWESINGPGSWEANPWVWVVEFRRVEKE